MLSHVLPLFLSIVHPRKALRTGFKVDGTYCTENEGTPIWIGNLELRLLIFGRRQHPKSLVHQFATRYETINPGAMAARLS